MLYAVTTYVFSAVAVEATVVIWHISTN